MIVKTIAEANLSFCCLQEVKYRNNGTKVITLNTGESYIFIWCGQKRRRDAGVGVLIKQCNEIQFEEPDILNPRIIAMNLCIQGFKIRLVNVYAYTNCDGAETQKDAFYRMIKKACLNQDKHQKLIVNGDFNATTSIALSQCFFDGRKIIDDPDCNANGTRIKSFCRDMKLCMTQTYFDHPIENRYTWYSPDKKTKKVLDYVLMESFVQQYTLDCKVDINVDMESDHRLVATEMCTPMTKRARAKQLKPGRGPNRINPKSLENVETRKQFTQAVTNELIRNQYVDHSGKKIITCLENAAQTTLKNMNTTNPSRQTWKEDKTLNLLLEQRKTFDRTSDGYKETTKKIKKHVRHLRNEKISTEAKQINEYSNRRNIEELYRSFKSDNSSFKKQTSRNKCDPKKLKEFFKKHFTSNTIDEDPIEICQAPQYILDLQNISADEIETGPPNEEELRCVIQNLKNKKAACDIPMEYIKYSMGSKEFVQEIVQLYVTIWETKSIPKRWGHSRLVTLWKGPAKWKIDDPKSYR